VPSESTKIPHPVAACSHQPDRKVEPLGAEAAVAESMTGVHDAEALVFDLWDNGGDSPAMVALVSSYLLGDEPVHLSDVHWREEDRSYQFWTP
jgi:hypothetical protein